MIDNLVLNLIQISSFDKKINNVLDGLILFRFSLWRSWRYKAVLDLINTLASDAKRVHFSFGTFILVLPEIDSIWFFRGFLLITVLLWSIE